MNLSEKKTYKNDIRRQKRNETRQALLINDYIKHIKPKIYEEAATFYNYLNERYPMKKDLRKTDEFKAMKLGFTYVEKNGKRCYSKQVFLPIAIDESTILTIDAQEPVHSEEATHPEGESETAKTEKIMQLRIPLMKSAVFTQTVSHVIEETIEQNSLQATGNEENPLQTAYNEVLSDSPQLHPTLSEEIPDEIINKILDELHQDPELNNIMNECEQRVETQQLDMDVGLPDIDDRLEQELENLSW